MSYLTSSRKLKGTEKRAKDRKNKKICEWVNHVAKKSKKKFNLIRST